MEINIKFTGGMKAEADLHGMTMRVDLPPQYGGEGTAPSPYQYFLGSIGTCAAVFVLSFCQKRNIPTEGMSITQRVEFVPGMGFKLGKVGIDINLPPDFPEKYIDAIVRVADQCEVKKAILDPPKIEVTTSIAK